MKWYGYIYFEDNETCIEIDRTYRRIVLMQSLVETREFLRYLFVDFQTDSFVRAQREDLGY